MMGKRLLSIAKQTGMMILIGYLSLAMLTGCSTVEMHVIDPVEPFKIDMPLAKSVAVTVRAEYKNDLQMKMLSWYPAELAGDLKTVMLESGATLTVQQATQCQGSSAKRTLCVTASRGGTNGQLGASF